MGNVRVLRTCLGCLCQSEMQTVKPKQAGESRRGTEIRALRRDVQEVTLAGKVLRELAWRWSLKFVEMRQCCLSAHLGTLLKFNPSYDNFNQLTFG